MTRCLLRRLGILSTFWTELALRKSFLVTEEFLSTSHAPGSVQCCPDGALDALGTSSPRRRWTAAFQNPIFGYIRGQTTYTFLRKSPLILHHSGRAGDANPFNWIEAHVLFTRCAIFRCGNFNIIARHTIIAFFPISRPALAIIAVKYLPTSAFTAPISVTLVVLRTLHASVPRG